MKFPFAVSTLAQLQNYSRGMVDHSVNVSVLSVYLAMQMGYSHTVILQHVGMGGLLHDIGKTQVQLKDDDDATVMDMKLRAHPEAGLKLIESQQKVPNEVKMIIAQHHECYDGTGFPKKMRGARFYDLARIVSIANVFDELVGDGRARWPSGSARRSTASTRISPTSLILRNSRRLSRFSGWVFKA